MDYQRLKQRHRSERHQYHPNLSLRVHRSLSWLRKAETMGDLDGQFIFLWIAFNAAYATEIEDGYRVSAKATFRDFLQKLVELDNDNRLEDLVWKEFPKSIRLLLDNKFVFQSFWDFQNHRLTREEWEQRFADGKKAAQHALGSQDTASVLGIVLNRTYTLRNQLIHGGATWGSSVNRSQVRDCVALLSELVPTILAIMMNHPDTLWGDPCYPVIHE